jgi:hypothetical protein
VTGRSALFVALFVLCGCGAKQQIDEPPPGTSSAPVRTVAAFSFQSLDARPVTSAAFAGRPLVLAFIATWDLLSQAQVRFLGEMDKHDAGKVAYAAVFLQDAKDRELIDVYRSTMGVSFPMAIAAQGTLMGGPFGDVQTVPTVVVLDAGGRVKFQKVGLATPEEIRAALPH